jgi:hypothetical protein
MENKPALIQKKKKKNPIILYTVWILPVNKVSCQRCWTILLKLWMYHFYWNRLSLVEVNSWNNRFKIQTFYFYRLRRPSFKWTKDHKATCRMSTAPRAAEAVWAQTGSLIFKCKNCSSIIYISARLHLYLPLTLTYLSLEGKVRSG